MSGLLLCSSKRGAASYVVEENRIEIRSLEELCYYLYHNIYRITEDFFSEELTGYLSKELEQRELSDRLEALKREQADVLELILAVCETANYYSQEELLELKQKLSDIAGLGKAQRQKRLADSSMKQKRYAQAIREYEAILRMKPKENFDENFEGKILHNMGIAYARMLMYREAEEYLLRAEQMAGEPQIRRELLLLYYLSENTRQYEVFAEGFPEEERKALEAGWEEKKKSVTLDAGRKETVIEKWKQEYRWEMT